MVSLAGIWSRMLLCSPHMSYSLCPCSPMAPDRPTCAPAYWQCFWGMGSTHWGVGHDGGVLSSPTPSACLSAVLGGCTAAAGLSGMEAARPPFRINEGSRGTGVRFLQASPALGSRWELLDGDRKGGACGRRVQKAIGQCYTSSSSVT